MKKILIIGVLVAIFLVSIGLVTAGNIFNTGNVTGESDNICNREGSCICEGKGNYICDRQCNAKQCCNQYINGKYLQNNNSKGCCKIN